MGHAALKENDLDRSAAFDDRIGFPEIPRPLDAEGKPWIGFHSFNGNLCLELFPGGTGRPAPDMVVSRVVV